MIKHYWLNNNLLHDTKARVMKMVSKKANKWRIKDWCPLTMLSIVYKLITKLLAYRLNPHNLALISPRKLDLSPCSSFYRTSPSLG